MLIVDVVHSRLSRRWLLRALSVVVALVAVSGNSLAGQLSLAWNPVAGATGYKLYYGTASRNYSSNVDAKNVTSYTVAGLTNGASYYFAVQAYNATATSGYSNEVSAVVPGSTTAAPVANFTASPTTGTAPVTVTFTDTSTGSVTTRSWDFGVTSTTGDTSTATNPSYTYTTAGSYTVTLTVTGPGGTHSTTRTITASAPTGGGSGTGTGGSAVNGLVAAYGFEEPTGTQTIDGSGYANHRNYLGRHSNHHDAIRQGAEALTVPTTGSPSTTVRPSISRPE